MKERWKTIRTGLLIIAFTIVGVLEYVQLMQSFDLPQMIFVVPLVGAVSMIVLKKLSFLVPVCTVLLSCIYQILAGDANAIARLQTNASSVTIILFECLSILLVFEFIGIGGGALIRALIDKKKSLATGTAACVAGVLITVGPYLAIFHNPLYPITARLQLRQYADEHFTNYAISDKSVYFSMQTSDYICRVSMSDGEIRVIYFDETGTIKEQ